MTGPARGCAVFPYTTLFRSIEHETASLTTQRAQWEDTLQERRLAVTKLAAAAKDAEAQVGMVDADVGQAEGALDQARDRKSTRLNSSHRCISYAVFCLKNKN